MFKLINIYLLRYPESNRAGEITRQSFVPLSLSNIFNISDGVSDPIILEKKKVKWNMSLIILILIVPILAGILLGLNILLAVHNPDESKISPYECGFLPHLGQTRTPFQIHYYIVGMLFLVFDMEILLLFPISISLYHISTFGFCMGLTFFLVLTIGFIFEIGSGAIGLTDSNSFSLIYFLNNIFNL